MTRALLAFVFALAVGQIARADTAYVKPSTFSPERDQTLTVEVAFNDDCCEPRYAVRSDHFVIIDSTGARQSPDRVEPYATTTILEHKITTAGTTRISTGERLGRTGEYVEIDGEYFLVNSPDAQLLDIPEGAVILSSQTATVSDAYVTVGAKDWSAIQQKVGRLAIEPAVHPDDAAVGIPYLGRIVFDGAPLADHTVILTTEMQRLTGEDAIHVRTDETGLFAFNFEHAGIHLIMARLQAPAPADAETDIRSYTTSLTLDVQPCETCS